jgi:hypothetical protein
MQSGHQALPVPHLGLLAAFLQASDSLGSINHRPDRLPTW